MPYIIVEATSELGRSLDLQTPFSAAIPVTSGQAEADVIDRLAAAVGRPARAGVVTNRAIRKLDTLGIAYSTMELPQPGEHRLSPTRP